MAAVNRRQREGISSLAAADLAADGRPDLLVARVHPEDGSGEVAVFKDGGGGALAAGDLRLSHAARGRSVS